MNKLREIFSNRWFKFGSVALVYTLIFVIWSQIWWSIIGLIVIFDIYISKYYHKLFWNKHTNFKESNSSYRFVMGWVEAIVFAVVVASFIRIYFVEMYVIPSPSMEKTLLVGDYLGVSKVSYGPKMPNTPLSIPFVHNISPLDKSKKSYLEWIKRPYRRLMGCDTVKHNDVVVFNYPEGDTVIIDYPQDNYYMLKNSYGRDAILAQNKLMVHPVDKRDNYIKRAVGLPGDNFQVINGEIFINSKASDFIVSEQQQIYYIRHQSDRLSEYALEKMNISQDDIIENNQNMLVATLTKEGVKRLEGSKGVIEVMQKVDDGRVVDSGIFPRDSRYKWSVDNFGPLWIPRREATIELTLENLPLYARAISVYEGNDLEVKNGDIYINGIKTNSYTFNMNYFFMMGDNRNNSLDSRYFGFVPEDHVVGRASFIWFSKEPGGSIRWSRLFTKIR